MRFLTEILAKAGITSNYVQLDTLAATPGGAPGRIVWNDVDGTLEFQMKGGNVTQQIGQELPVLVKHADNTGLTNGKVVYQFSSDGANVTVKYASASSETTASKTFGVMTEDATGGAKGFCTTFGYVRNINTSALTEGAMIWLSETPGEMTTTRPTQPAHGVVVGRCIRQHATQGVIFVSVQNGFELEEIHDVLITSKANNDFIVYESATNLWKNKTISAVLGYTPANGANYLALTGGTLTGDLTLSGVNPRLYFTDTDNNPDYFISNTDGTFTVYDVTNSVGRFKIYSTGNAEFTGALSVGGNLSVNNGANTTVSLNGAAFVGTEYSRNSNIYGFVGTENSASGGMRYNSVNGNYEHNFYTNSSLSFKLTSTGAATFSSSVFSGGDLYTAAGLRFNGSGLNASDKKLYSPVDGELQWMTHSSAGAHAFSISHQGTRQVYLDVSGNSYLNGGNVGIGTTSPAKTLHVYTTGNEGIFLQGTGGGVWMNIQSAAGNLWSIGAQNDGMGVYNRTSSLYAFFIKDNRQLQLPSYTASSSYTGTAAGYLAFDSSGNVITVAGVAATDNTKLPLTGGALTGPLTITGNGSYLGDWGYKTLELNDTSGYAGIFFKNGNNIWINRRNGADNAMDWAYSTNASAQGTGTFAQKMRLASDEWWVSTYPGYKLQVTGGDQINVTNAGNATTLYLQYQGGVGAALNIAAGKYTLDNSGNGSASSSWRAPIFYDSNDTGYYGDFNGTSSLWGLAIRGDNGASSTANQIFFWGTGNTTTSAIGFKSNAAPFANPTGAGDGYNTYFTMDTPGRGWVFRRGTGGSDFSAAYTAGWILNNGIWQANSEMRAPVFRFTNSSNNAYLTGNSDWGFRVVNDSGYIQFGPANGSWAHIYSGLPFYFNQALYVNGTQVVTNSGTWGINVTGTANNITAYTINQSVGTGNAPTFADVYTNGWFRNNTNNAGLYSQANNVHFSSSSDGRWNIGSGGRTNGALVFYQDHMTTLKGYVYWDGSGFGLLNNQGGWSVLAYQGTSYGGELRGSWYTTGNITTGGKISNGSVWINNGADYNSYNENIRLFAAPNGVSVIAFNASGISGTPAGGSILGFDDRLEIRKGGDAWQLRAYSGYVEASGSFRAPIFYDSNDTGYYLDPNGESNLWRFTAQSMTRNAINYLSINSPVNTRAGQSGPYLNGTMGWGNTDFNTIFSNWGSGFIDTWSSPSNAPGGSSHYVGLQGLHYNHQNGTNGYGFQMACAGEADNRFFWRSSWATPRSWVEMIHSGNIGSQSVNYASSTPWSGVTSKPGNITYWDTWYGSSYLGSNGNLYMGWAGAWLDGWLNQNVKSNAGPTFQTVYLNDWCRVRYETGVYFESYDAGLRSAYQASFGQVATYGTARSAHGGYIIVNNYITNLMQDTSGNFGFFSNNDWAWRLFYNRGNNCWGIGTDNTYSGDGFRCVKYGSAEYGWTTWSDRRAKENISTISGALDKVLSMRGVYYNYIKDETKSQHVGFIAQELIDVLPQSVRYAEEIDEYNINYGPIVSILAEAIKEQDIKMKIQEDKISLLQAQLQTLLN